MARQASPIRLAALYALLCASVLTACGQGGDSSSSPVDSSRNYPVAGSCSGLTSCPALTGTPWVPNVSGASSSNHDGTVTVSRTTITKTGVPLTGLGQAAPAWREVSVTFDMTDDLGPNGSITLEAKVRNFPSGLYGNAYPVLVSLSDGTNDYINLARSGTAGDCASAGYYTCSGGLCSANSGCTVNWPSAYQNRNDWEQHQVTIPSKDSDAFQAWPSVNTFPTCNWTGGNPPPDSSQPACAFNSTFFPTGAGYPTPRLRYGVNYTAKYVLLANSYESLDNYSADLDVTVVKKTDNSSGGAIDLNVILVGTKNVQASRTAQGKRNLDTLFSKVYSWYDQASTGVKLGSIHAIEFPCDECGDYYTDMPVYDLNFLYQNTASLIPSSTNGKAVNLYMVSTIPDPSSGGFTILGLAGAIGGSVSIGSPLSGVSFSSFNELDTYNPACSTDPCPDGSMDSSFAEFAETIAHELGHYLGLNHPSERDGTMHDAVDDTPICTATDSAGNISISSCLNDDTNVFPSTNQKCSDACLGYSASAGTYCPNAQECQFNHIMWWTTKNYDPSTGEGDGKIFSSHSGGIINYSSFVQ